MKLLAAGWPAAFVRALLVACAAALLGSCGSGAVSGAPAVNDPNRIVMLPSTATLYSGLPTSFTVTGGTNAYIVSSSNQAIISAPTSVTSGGFTVIPSEVTEDTQVTLTVRDTGSTPLATSVLTVRPGTVGNNITITPSSTQGGTCLPAICSGGDAEVSVQLARGGQPLVQRGVRFEVVTGDVRFITSQPGNAETTDLTTTTLTDETGRARARLRVAAVAPNQTAILRIVDLGSGAFQTTSFTIAQATGSSPGFFASPDSITFSGPNNQECASSGSVDVFIYGGTPPYTVSTVGAPFIVTREFVSFSGGSFSVLPRGICVGTATSGAPITITDASGRSTVVRVANIVGANAAPQLVVAPTTVSITECNAVASVAVAGGNGSYTVNSGNSAIFARLSNNGSNTVIISRQPNLIPPPQVQVGVSSGSAATAITVDISGNALGSCDGQPFAVSPSTVTLAGCGSVFVDATNAFGAVTATSNNSSVTPTVNQVPGSNTARIELQRTGPPAPATPSPAFTGATVFVRDQVSTRTVTVNGTGTCP